MTSGERIPPINQAYFERFRARADLATLNVGIALTAGTMQQLVNQGAHFDENEPLLVAPDGKAFHLTVNEPGGAIAALYDSRYAVLRKLREQRLELGDTFSGTRLGVEVCGGWDGLDPGMRILLEQDNGDETLSRIRAFASASIRLAKRVEEV